MKWFVLLLLLLGGWYVAEHWSFLTAQWTEQMAHFTGAPPAKATPEPTRPNHPKPAVESWSPRTVAGLRFNLPYDFQRYEPEKASKAPSNYFVEAYKAEVGGRKISITHAINPNLVGAVMLAWADAPLGLAADRLKMDVISSNTATTLINGLRARRSDYVSQGGSPRTRARVVLLERANQAWVVEVHAPENDAGAESLFLRIAQSAQ